MSRQEFVIAVFLGIVVGVLLNLANLADAYRAHSDLSYVFAAIFFTSVGTALIVWAYMKYKYRKGIEVQKKFQIPGKQQ